VEAFRRSQLGQWFKQALLERRQGVLGTVIGASAPCGVVNEKRFSATELREEGVYACGRMSELDTIFAELYEDPPQEVAP
jgi:hypothetical protein